MEHFLLQLTKTSAIGGAVIALLLTLRPFLGKRYRARMYYWLWLVLAVALLPSPVYTGANAPVQITPPSEHVMVWTDKAAIVPKISHKDNFVTVSDGVTPALSHIQPGDDFTQSLPSTPIRRIVDVSSVLFWAWLAGVAMFLTVQAIGYGRFRRLAHRWSEPLKNDRYGEFLREEASALGLTAPKAAFCPAVSTPALTGLIRPKLLLPHEDYTETELRFVLRHELTHLKHRDIPYKLLLTFANALHWFNPLVYLMLRAADEDIELSCDSAVTRNMEKEERAAYSETLLKAVRSKGDTVVLTSCFGSTVERLKRRITNILDGRKKSRGVAVIVLAICTVAALGAAIGFAPAKDAGTPAKTQEETEREQSFTVDERFSPALWIDPLYADALLNATTIGYVDETRSLPYFTTDILTNLTRDDTHEYPDGGAAFAVVDLDRDGTAEVVYRRSDYRGYIVLHTYHGGVCAHELNYREMTSLKRDGSIRASGGADVTAINRVRFDGAEMLIDYDEFGVGGSASDGIANVTQEEFDERIDAFEARPDVTWYDFTEENVRSVLGTNRGTRTVAFDDIMGLSGFYSETTDGANFITRRYYVPAVVGGYTPIGGSFGYNIDDHVVDLDGDGVTELVCNCQYGADGAQRVFVYRLKNGAVEQGFCGSVYSTLPDYNNWGVNGSGEYYDADADEFVLGYSTTRGAVEMAEKRFTYRLLDFVPYAFNDSPYPQPVLPEKAAETAKPTAESIKASAASSVDYGGFLWFVADGYFSRYADTGSIEQLYELPLGYDDETPVFASISVIAAKVALSYHVGGAIMGYDELRLFDTQTGAQTHEISGYGSFAINGDTIVKTTGFMPPAAGNLRISRDCGKTWENLGDPKYLYGMSVTADGNTVSYRGEQGSLSLHDDYLYIAGVDTSSWDGSSTQLPETLSLCIDLETGETVERID